VEQIIADGYALSAIEGMSCGLAVLSNLSNKNLCNMFRRYSYLSECPILSANPENVYKQLKTLLNNPSLIEKLGEAGRSYVEKYHSNITAQYMFEKIYESFNGAQVDLINLFHPILGEYNKSLPFIEHPLVDNLIS
jgi:glycosyltransferase involved in cell wall biosynthesis